MADSISATNSTTSTSSASNNITVNPDSELSNDDFMKLLLTELQYQDPTSPMESDQILQQTSQLATLETQQNTNKVMEELASSFQTSLNFSAISAIGKTAILSDKVTLEEGSSVSFPLDFSDKIQSGNINITNSTGTFVKTIALESNDAGIYTFNWDGTDNNGDAVSAGAYTISADYINDSGKSLSTSVGNYPIESIAFEDGKSFAKLGGQYIPFENILEVTE